MSTRPISTIAADIRLAWPRPYFAAVPYLDAMSSLSSITDRYYADTAEEVVLRFLANSSTWRGEQARSIKAELRALVGNAGS